MWEGLRGSRCALCQGHESSHDEERRALLQRRVSPVLRGLSPFVRVTFCLVLYCFCSSWSAGTRWSLLFGGWVYGSEAPPAEPGGTVPCQASLGSGHPWSPVPFATDVAEVTWKPFLCWFVAEYSWWVRLLTNLKGSPCRGWSWSAFTRCRFWCSLQEELRCCLSNFICF